MSNILYTDKKRSSILCGEDVRPTPETLEFACYQNALRAYEDKNLLDAIANLEKVIRHNPHYKDVQERLGYYRQELEGIQANEVLLRIQRNQNPDDVETLFDLADTLYVLGKTAEAVALWKELIVRDTGYWGKQAQKMLKITQIHSDGETELIHVASARPTQ